MLYVYTGVCVSEFVLLSCLLCVAVATLWCSLACCDHMLDCSNKLPAFLCYSNVCTVRTNAVCKVVYTVHIHWILDISRMLK